MPKKHQKTHILTMSKQEVGLLIGVAFFGGVALLYGYLTDFLTLSYTVSSETKAVAVEAVSHEPPVEVFVATHVATPEAVKAIYMTQCVAGTPSFRDRLITLIEETEINSVMIDIKDFTGKLGLPIDHPLFKDLLSERCHAKDMRQLIERLHENGIYVIGRITVFQDPYYAQQNPHLAVQKESDKSVWADHKGLHFIDPGATEYWDVVVELAKASYAEGFDEINFDYIRFPSDGDMQDIYFPLSNTVVENDPILGKAKVVESFFAYLNARLAGTGPVLSADLFGMTMTNTDDLNIGQILEYAEPYFDYIAPMVYPSHYPWGFNDWDNPNEHVYDVIKYSMDKGVERMKAASTSPLKLRPWLQDFDYGGDYGPEEVRAQIQATYDAGLTSWMLWDSSNIYTKEALLP